MFRQLSTLHVLKSGKVLPCAYGLMVLKRKAAYRRLFRELTDFVDEEHLPHLQPTSVMSDHESFEAFKEVFPGAEVNGCLFHFSQAVRKKIQGEGRQEAYKGGDLQELCRQLMALPSLSEEAIPQAFAWLEDLAEGMNLGLVSILEYMEDQWIDNARLPLSLWCCHGKDIRTNNAVEGWHHRFNRRVNVTHPNVWVLLERVKTENTRTELLASQIDAGNRIPLGKATYSTLNQRVHVLEARRVAEEINDREFLSAVGRLLHF